MENMSVPNVNINENSSLHNELIEYATTSFRLMFIQDDSVFANFQSISSEFDDLSSMELKAIVLNDILPKIHSYHLTETIKKRLKLLDLHPGFRKTAQGYQYAAQHMCAPYVLTPRFDFSLSEQLPQLLVSSSSSSNPNIYHKAALRA